VVARLPLRPPGRRVYGMAPLWCGDILAGKGVPRWSLEEMARVHRVAPRSSLGPSRSWRACIAWRHARPWVARGVGARASCGALRACMAWRPASVHGVAPHWSAVVTPPWEEPRCGPWANTALGKKMGGFVSHTCAMRVITHRPEIVCVLNVMDRDCAGLGPGPLQRACVAAARSAHLRMLASPRPGPTGTALDRAHRLGELRATRCPWAVVQGAHLEQVANRRGTARNAWGASRRTSARVGGV